MAGTETWKTASSISAGLAIASILAIVMMSAPYQRWGEPIGGFLLGGYENAEKLVNPYGVQVIDAGGKFALVQGASNGAILFSLAHTAQYSGAMASNERLVVARWSNGFTAIFLKGFTLKEALTLSREPRLADEFGKPAPIGAFALSEEQILGKNWLAVVSENWAYVIMGSAILYLTYVIFYALFGPPRRYKE